MTYEYKCEECGREFEVEQSMKDPVLEICPYCNNQSVHRLVSKVGFILNGTGWPGKAIKSKK